MQDPVWDLAGLDVDEFDFAGPHKLAVRRHDVHRALKLGLETHQLDDPRLQRNKNIVI